MDIRGSVQRALEPHESFLPLGSVDGILPVIPGSGHPGIYLPLSQPGFPQPQPCSDWPGLRPGEAPTAVRATAPEAAVALRRVLIVEQDASLTKFLSRGLAAEHFAVHVLHDGAAAREEILRSRYDLVLFDLDLPGLDGMRLLEQVRREDRRLPMMVLTARGEDLVAALSGGADDFLVKPFSFVELAARMQALLRRSGAGGSASAASASGSGVVLRIGALTVDRAQYRVERAGRSIELTPREFALLECLMGRADCPVSRETLMDEVWKAELNPASNIVDVYMKYLRDKVDHPGEEKLIRTIRGVGYVIGSRAA